MIDNDDVNTKRTQDSKEILPAELRSKDDVIPEENTYLLFTRSLAYHVLFRYWSIRKKLLEIRKSFKLLRPYENT